MLLCFTSSSPAMDSYCPPLTSLLLPLLLLIFTPCLFAPPDDSCPPFHCGNLTVEYPFWAGFWDGWESCGPSDLTLGCESGKTTLRTPAGKMFIILRLHQGRRSMQIAPYEFFHGECPAGFNFSDLNVFNIFRYSSADDYENKTLYYNCDSSELQTPEIDHLRCNTTSFISLTEQGCRNSFTIPVLRRPQLLDNALKGGFELNWKEFKCCMCDESKSECGDRPPHVICGPGQKSKSKLGLIVGITVGSVAAIGVGLMVAAAILISRRRKHLVMMIARSKTQEPVAGARFTTDYYQNTASDLENSYNHLGVRVFSYDELVEATHNFDASRELGNGAFGVVYGGKLADGRAVAVKRLYERSFKRTELFMNEVQILIRLRHPNLVTLYGFTSRRSRELLLVYEYIPKGTVADHLYGAARATSAPLPWPARLGIAVETADALAYLHASDIIHRDVKTSNILLDDGLRAKVADFGLSRLFPGDVTHVSTAPQGTPGYIDPLYYEIYRLTDRSDVYSFGVVLVELLSSKQAVDTGRHRRDINLASMAMRMIQEGALRELVDPRLGFEEDAAVRREVTMVAELAFRCLQTDGEMRPSMEEVVDGLRWIKKDDEGEKTGEDGETRSETVGGTSPPPPTYGNG